MGCFLCFWFKYLSFSICSLFFMRIKIISFYTYFINIAFFLKIWIRSSRSVLWHHFRQQMLVPHDGNYGGPHSELHPFYCSPGRQGPRRLQVRIVKIAIFTQITLIDFHAALKMRTIIYFTFPISSWLFTSIPSLTKLKLNMTLAEIIILIIQIYLI